MRFSGQKIRLLAPVRLEASVECRSESGQGLLGVYCRVPQPAPWVLQGVAQILQFLIIMVEIAAEPR